MKILSLLTLSIIVSFSLNANEFSLVKPISVERATTKTASPTSLDSENIAFKAQVNKANKTKIKDFTNTKTLAINFERGNANIPKSDTKTLEDFKNYLNENKGYQAIIYSYTDSIGSEIQNRTLSEKRAKNIKQALESMGLSSTRLTAIGKGEKEPIADNTYEDGRNKNNRIEILIIK